MMSAGGEILNKLRARIRADGPIGLDAFMEICLADPEYGYYRRRDPIGAAGDFTTSPEISQIFGELIGLALAQSWMDQGRPAPFLLVELGPGRGRLMADALRAARAAPGFLEAAELALVETSPTLRAAQKKILAGAALSPRWLDRLEDAPAAPIFLIANEFFDALPIRQWRKEASVWRERRVALGPEGGLVFDFADAGEILGAAAPLAEAPEGAWFERNAAGEAVAREIGGRLAQNGGAALIIDYAYTAAQRREAGWPETFQAMRAHAYDDPLAAPGEADLTAHVDFSALAAAAEDVRAAVQGPVSQGQFLLRLGAEHRLAALAKANPAEAESLSIGLGRLTDPREMGALFKVLGLTGRGAPPIAGLV